MDSIGCFFVPLSILGEDDDLQPVNTRCTIVPQMFVQSFFQSSPEGFRIAGEEPVGMIIWDVPSYWFNLICSTILYTNFTRSFFGSCARCYVAG